MNEIKKQSGTTLIELIIALVIAGIVVSLGFTVYGNITRQFHTQSNNTESIRSKIIVKKQMNRVCSMLSVVDYCSEREVRGVDEITDSIVKIKFHDGSVFHGADTVVTGVKQCSFELMEKKRSSDNKKAVLQWEVVCEKSGWIGGTVVVNK